ncbi:MAG: Uma2 family endonuclease, partial [Leptolyngbyaceae bacterium]|nr:Uma2 family endonuclease [Leptolyngbyaceae bacterium]
QGKHSVLQRELTFSIDNTLKLAKVARAFPELRCTFGGRSIVPDIAIFLANRIPRDETGEIANVFALAPDWMIEILSPEQNQTKVIDKILYALDYGCQMGWFLDPSEQLVITYPTDSRSRSFYQSNELLPVPEWAQTYQLTVGQLFGWLLD